VLDRRTMPGARWFEGATLNYAQQIFRHAGTGLARQRTAIRHAGEAQPLADISWDALESQVASVAHALRQMGVTRGDRVAGYLPNVPETIVAFLATVSVGAIWSGCAPDMGQVAVIDRFRQIEPKVLIAVDGYRYGGKTYDRAPVVADLVAALPSLTDLVIVPSIGSNVTPEPMPGATPGATCWRTTCRSRSRRSRSIIRCGSSIRPAPPVCQSQSSTGTAAS
jgi:acetoacetyl-CoA synthetase